MKERLYVDARQLWEKIGSKRNFIDWIEYHIISHKEGLSVNKHYKYRCRNITGGRPLRDFTLTLEAAEIIAKRNRTPFIIPESIIKTEEEMKLFLSGSLSYFEAAKKLGVKKKTLLEMLTCKEFDYPTPAYLLKKTFLTPIDVEILETCLKHYKTFLEKR